VAVVQDDRRKADRLMITVTLSEIVDRPLALRKETVEQLLAEVIAGRAIEARQAARTPARAPAGIGILPILGAIEYRPSWLGWLFGGVSLVDLATDLATLVADRDVATIVMPIDSPGGDVAGLTEFAERLRRARARKPIIAVADTMAASAAFWLGAQATELVASPSSWLGSVGVYVAHTELSEAEAKAGIKTTMVHAGRYKTEGNTHEPLTESARAHIQGIVDGYYNQFVTDVAAGRGVPRRVVEERYGQGRMLLAKDALAAGMVDRIATSDDVTRGAMQQATSARASVAFYRQRIQAREASAVRQPPPLAPRRR
jgi:signal peptide peptidase SppA